MCAGGKGAYAALDAVAGPGFQQVLSCVRKGGCVISYGILSSSQITLDVMPLLRDVGALPSHHICSTLSMSRAAGVLCHGIFRSSQISLDAMPMPPEACQFP